MPGLKELGKIHTVWKTEQLKRKFLRKWEEKEFKPHFTLYPQVMSAKKKGRQ